MPLTLSEEQQLLKDSAREFLQTKAPLAQLRQLRDTKDAVGFDRTLWQEMAEMGWAALPIPEAYGGLDFGYTGLGQVLEETGRRLTASPLVSTVLLSATAIILGGSEAQKQNLLPDIASGNLTMSLALEEGRQHQPHPVNCTAKAQGEDYVIQGSKNFVLDGHVADQFIVVTACEGATELFVVPADAPGLSVMRVFMMDSRNAAKVEFDGVKVPANAKLDAYESGFALLEKTLDIARIGLAAEMLGGILEAFERTVAYLKEREQFGVHIGSFQALQHRAAVMFGEIELCKSIVLKALQAIDGDDSDLPRLASQAKAKLGQTYQLVSNEGVQLFGGIGMTDDEEIGFFLKRARVVQQTLGDAPYHLDRLAKLSGY